MLVSFKLGLPSRSAASTILLETIQKPTIDYQHPSVAFLYYISANTNLKTTAKQQIAIIIILMNLKMERGKLILLPGSPD